MKIRMSLTVFLVLTSSWSACNARAADKKEEEQTETVPFFDPIQKGRTVRGITSGFGVAHKVSNSVPDQRFLALGGRIGRVLTGPWGLESLRGHLEVSVEGLPIFLHKGIDTTYGVSFTLLVRQYFAPCSRWRPFMTLGAGALVTAAEVPEATSRLNFTPQAGLGLAFARNERTLFTFEYRFHHISNGDTAELNPGINSSSFHFGVSLFK